MIGGDIVVTENVSTTIKAFGMTFRKSAATEMDAFGNAWITTLVSTRLNGRPGVGRRTGNLARSFKSRVTDSALLNAVVLDVQPEGPGSEYANLQEFGGTIRPVKAKNLWIPIAGNLNPSGTARISPREAIAQGGFFAKGVFFGRALTKNKVPQRSQHLGGSGYKGAEFKRGENITPLFVLKKSVRVEGRMGASALWAQSMPALTNRLDALATRMFSSTGGA